MRIAAIILLVMALLGSMPVAAQEAKTKLVHQDEILVVGIDARTSGEKEMTGEGVIPDLWQRFYQERILDTIPNKVDASVYALYAEFSRDRMGAYTVVIGARVKDKSHVPAGFVLKVIPAGTYAVIASDKGPAPTVIPAAWLKVAALEDKEELGGKRAYKTDFEVYQQLTDPQNVQADLFVGLKEAPAQK